MSTAARKVGYALAPPRIGKFFFTRDKSIPINLGSTDVQVHMPTLNEEDSIEETMKSLYNNELISEGDISIKVLDSDSEDNTVQLAKEYADDVVQVPEGKLTARNFGIEEFDPDIVMTADAGDIYPPGWASALLEPFANPNVVATRGPCFSKDPTRLRIHKWIQLQEDVFQIAGNNSAIRAEAYKEAGWLDENIDQFSLWPMVFEEQYDFRRRLEELGTVEFVPDAAILKSQRRAMFTIEDANDFRKSVADGNRF